MENSQVRRMICSHTAEALKYAPVPVSAQNLTAKQLWPHVQRCGYGSTTVIEDITLADGRTAAFAGFAQRPFDTRSACLVAMDVVTSPAEDAKACRSLGAPLTLLCHQGCLLWWSQTDRTPYQIGEPILASRLDAFFREHKKDFAPQTIYRAKTLGRFDQTCQRTFVDLGLMPMLEMEAGKTIERLLLDCVAEARDTLNWPKAVDLNQGQWLVKSVFWLLGAKMLHDKEVEGFIRLDFGDVDGVFDRVAAHYGESADGLIKSQAQRRAIEAVGRRIAHSANLRLATTEALGYVYENTLISKEIRAEFGTHSTPAYLVDYIVGRMEPWIREMGQDQRSVFEPACGHAAFLVAAIRLLTSLLPANMAEPLARKRYLRDRVRGYDVDTFAVEIARLSLTLTDIPNPNGWSVKPADLFASDLIEKAARESTILLANPPFEDLNAAQRADYAGRFRKPQFLNKTAEILHRALSVMPAGGVFGVVVPQTLLHGKNASAFRKLLVDQCEFQEICLFPDKVFNFADQESAMLIGRKDTPALPRSTGIRYRRVRERQMGLFRNSYEVTSEANVPQGRFQHGEETDLRVADLEPVWERCGRFPTLDDYVDVGQGFTFIGETQPGFPSGERTASDAWFEGAIQGFENLGADVFTHQLPVLKWLSLSPRVVRRAMSGTTVGIPQVLLNEAPVQRAPWCLKAMIDRQGMPAKSRFTLLRPRDSSLSLASLWGLMNSPITNAWAYTHSTKRNILTGTVRQVPIPRLESVSLKYVERAALDFLLAVEKHEQPFPLRSEDTRAHEKEALRILHWRIDAEVLRLYALPVELERELLDFFAGWKRVGVPFHQERYFPEGFDEPISLADYLAITVDWDATNKRRLELVEKKAAKTITTGEREEWQRLQRLAGLKRELLSSPSLKELAATEADLRRRGLWRGA